MSEDFLDEDEYFDNGRRIFLKDDLSDIGQSTKEILNIDTDYQPAWGPLEGFRENFQNWKDGIMASFEIRERDFKLEPQHSQREELFVVYHPNKAPKQMLGFIRFSYDKNDLGVCELTNFKASLQRRHLGIGGTTKRHDASQLGQHGEGLKLSALVNRRYPHNYNFVVTSTNCRWIFGWDINMKLNCRIQRISTEKLFQQMSQCAQRDEGGAPREAAARPWEDVSVVIGEPRRCRSNNGETETSKKIPLADFNDWKARILDFNPPEEMYVTHHGALILDASYYGRVFLHGLELQSGSKSGKPFQYSYNLLNLRTGRDRDTVANARTEAEKIYQIWSHAILDEYGRRGTDILGKYFGLLRDHFADCADLSGITYLMEDDIAKLVWEYMLSERLEGRLPFYYCASEDQQGLQIITDRLERHPVSIKKDLWDIFRDYHLCLTPKEECSRRFQSALPAELQQDIFSQHIIKALRGLMSLDNVFQDTKILPVEGRKLGINVMYHQKTFKIDEKLFTYEGAHGFDYCQNSSDADDIVEGVFSCDHIILWLWDHMITSLREEAGIELTPSHALYLKSMARIKVQQMPRGLHVQTNDSKTQMTVHWESMEPVRNADHLLQITLHDGICLGKTNWVDKLVHQKGTATCHCPRKTSKIGTGKVTFGGVGLHTRYLPKVSRDGDDVLYGIFKAPVRLSELEVCAEELDLSHIEHSPSYKKCDQSSTVNTPSTTRIGASNGYVDISGDEPRLCAQRLNSRDSVFSLSQEVIDVSDDESEVSEEGSEERLEAPTVDEVSKLFEKPAPEDWTAIGYESLFKDGFPYAHTWISAQQDGSQLLIAKPKPAGFKRNLKRVLEDDDGDDGADTDPRQRLRPRRTFRRCGIGH